MFDSAAGPSRAQAWLSWVEDEETRSLELGNELRTITIGRSSRAEVCLGHQQVSRRHAQIAWDGQVWIVRDLGSRNGTRVGAVEAGAGLALAHSDVVRCGPVALVFSWPAGVVEGSSQSQPVTLVGSALPQLTSAEMTLLQELCRPYLQGEDPRTSATEPVGNAQLAERLGLGEDGVRQRLKRLYPKLGLDGPRREKRRELAAHAIELGFVRPGPHASGTNRTPG